MPARAFDARMFAWYKLDELVAGDFLNMADSGPNARHLTAASIAVAPKITNGKNGVRFARVFDGTNDVATRTSNAGADAAALAADHTFMAFVRIDASTAQCLGGYGQDGDASSASNQQSTVRFTAARLQEHFHEHGSGVNVVITQAAGSALPLGEWCHIARVIDRAAKSVAFYLDGVLQDTVTYATNPTGGTTAIWVLGQDQPTTPTLMFQGAAKSVTWVAGKLTGAEIAAAAAVLNSTMLHDPARAGTIVCYQCNEAPDAIDESDRGCHLYVTAGTVTHGVDPLVADGGRAKYFGGNAELHGPPAPDPNGVLWNAFMDGEWSFEVWLRLGDGNSTQRGLFLYGDPGPEDSPNNFFGVDLEANRKIQVYSENGAGADEIWTSTADVLAATQVNGPHQLVITKRNVSGGYVLRAYRDGVFVEESPTQTPDFDGGLLGFLRLATGPGEVDWFGVLDEVVFWQAVLTDDEVAELNDFGTGEASDPTPSFVAPPTYMGDGTGGIGFLVD